MHHLQGSTTGTVIAASVFTACYLSQLAPLRRMVLPKGAQFRSPTSREFSKQLREGAKKVNNMADFLKDVAPHIVVHGMALSVADFCAGITHGYYEAGSEVETKPVVD